MFKLNRPVSLKWVCDAIEAECLGNSSYEINNVASFEQASKNSLSFFKKSQLIENGTGAIIALSECNYRPSIISADPRLDFIKALYILDLEIGFEQNYPTAQVHPSTVIGENAVISDGVIVGKHTILEPNVVLLPGVTIGENCLIRANATLGSDGFGFERQKDGSPVKFIHLGGVDIGDNVEIGANTCIARGTLKNTIIEGNVKIDNLVHIAHNCHIKKGAFVIACAEVSGGVIVGENAWVAPNATITQQIEIGDGALVGLGAVVTKSVEEKTIVIGNPAKFFRKTTD